MEGRLLKQPSRGKLVEHNINKLTVLQNEKNPQATSPSWHQLQGGSSRVKKLSKLFEENSRAYHAKPNWWLDDSLCKSVGSPTSKPRVVRTTSNSPRNLLTKLHRITHEFLQKELTYIDALERGINIYVEAIKAGDEEVPSELRHQTFRLFANLEEIYKLHKEEIYPQLLACNGDARLIAETITNFIQDERFYCYIFYGIHQKSSEQLISQHLGFFEQLRSSADDLLGIFSFIIQPIQKLPRYKMLFDELIKELGRDVLSNKSSAAACCVAEKSLQRLLVRFDEALSLNDIIEVNLLRMDEQMSTISSLQNSLRVIIDEPTLMIVPKASTQLPYRPAINVYDFGKFHKATVVKAEESNRSFSSKVFVFEKCLLYTRVIKDNAIGYRNHFMFNSCFGFNIKDSQVSIRVNTTNKRNDVIFSSDNIESIAEIKKLIKQFHDPRRSNDSAFVDGNGTGNETDDGEWALVDHDDVNPKLGERLFKTMLRRLKNSN